MPRLNQTTQRLMQDLYGLSSSSLFNRRRRHRKTILLLHEVAKQETLDVLPPAAAHLFSSSKEVRRAARDSLHCLVSRASPRELLRLTDLVGSSWTWYVSKTWNRLGPNQIRSLVAERCTQSSVLGLVSFHHNGYVRHEAIKLLSNVHDGSELAFLLIRQNDWVRNISADATQAVRARLTQDYLPHLVRNLPLVIHLLTCSRYDHSALVKRVNELLVRPENAASLTRAIESPTRAVRREVLRVALDSQGEHVNRIVAQGLASADAVVRLRCARVVRHCYSVEQLPAILGRLKQDRFMPVRREGLLAEAETFPEKAAQVWEAALLDASSSIRELARFSLANLRQFNASEFYRRALKEKPESLAALQGLAETGNVSDVTTFRTYLNNSRPRCRRTAVQGLAAVGEKEDIVKELVERLRDESPGVVRMIRRQLQGVLDVSANDELFTILLESKKPNVRDAVLHLISSTGKWASLPWLFQASVLPDEDTAALARQLVLAWTQDNRVFTKPSNVERQALQRAWNASESMAPVSFRQDVDNWLKNV